MKAENVSLDDSGQWEVIEETCEVLPNIGISILSEALVIETINLCDLLALMVSSEDSDSAWVSHLKGDQKSNSLDWVVASINVISHEEIVVVWQLSSNLEEFFQIIELSMDISANGHWGPNWLHIAFID